MDQIPTLYEWAGKNEALEKLTSLFYDKVAKDELLAPVFKNMSGDHSKLSLERSLAALYCIRTAMAVVTIK